MYRFRSRRERGRQGDDKEAMPSKICQWQLSGPERSLHYEEHEVTLVDADRKQRPAWYIFVPRKP